MIQDPSTRVHPHLYGHMQEVAVIQAGFDRPVLVTAAADVRVRRAHDEELVEVALGQELKEHADRLLLGHHTQEAHHVWVLELRQHRHFLGGKTERELRRLKESQRQRLPLSLWASEHGKGGIRPHPTLTFLVRVLAVTVQFCGYFQVINLRFGDI